jgi:hypothetical protein
VATDREQPSHPAFPAWRQMRLVVLGACALPLLTYVVVWCAIGQLSVRDSWRQFDWIHPLFPRLIEVVAGIVSGILLALVLWVLIRAVRRGQLARPGRCSSGWSPCMPRGRPSPAASSLRRRSAQTLAVAS